MWRNDAKLLDMKYGYAVTKHRCVGRKKIGEATARKLAEEPQQEELPCDLLLYGMSLDKVNILLTFRERHCKTKV
jgi:hypothetical protein